MKETLVQICRAFEKKNIRFGIGASLLLMAYGIVDKASDIDLVVHIEDVPLVKSVMAGLGELTKSSNNSLYDSEIFLEYNVDGIGVDIMANFTIKTEDGLYVYPFSEHEIVLMGEEKLPYLSLVNWEKAYRLMGRMEKADLVLEYLNLKS